MADHLDAFVPGAPGLLNDPNLAEHSPGMDPRVDITDIYAFQTPGDPTHSTLIMGVNPLTLSLGFRHDALYRLNIDTNGDAIPDRMLDIRFSRLRRGRQRATVKLVVRDGTDDGEEEEVIEEAPVSFGRTPIVTQDDGVTFFAGLRSDPFFFDLVGFLNNLHFTGSDFFAAVNVYGIVLDVPNAMLGPSPNVGLWGQTLIRHQGRPVTVDQMGRPAINTVFNAGSDKNLFNETPPHLQAGTVTATGKTFFDNFVGTLHALNPARTDAQNRGLASVLLPDVLTYNAASAAGFLNGRKLADDVIDAELQLLTGNPAAGDGVGPHSDYLPVFPFLGNPH